MCVTVGKIHAVPNNDLIFFLFIRLKKADVQIKWLHNSLTDVYIPLKVLFREQKEVEAFHKNGL